MYSIGTKISSISNKLHVHYNETKLRYKFKLKQSNSSLFLIDSSSVVCKRSVRDWTHKAAILKQGEWNNESIKQIEKNEWIHHAKNFREALWNSLIEYPLWILVILKKIVLYVNWSIERIVSRQKTNFLYLKMN